MTHSLLFQIQANYTNQGEKVLALPPYIFCIFFIMLFLGRRNADMRSGDDNGLEGNKMETYKERIS